MMCKFCKFAVHIDEKLSHDYLLLKNVGRRRQSWGGACTLIIGRCPMERLLLILLLQCTWWARTKEISKLFDLPLWIRS